MTTNGGGYLVTALAVLVAYESAGCFTVGRDIQFENTQKLVVGVSTRADAESLFGPPSAIGTSGGNTSEVWSYGHAGLYGTNVGGKALTLIFGPDGKYLGISSMAASGTDVVPASSGALPATSTITPSESAAKRQTMGAKMVPTPPAVAPQLQLDEGRGLLVTVVEKDGAAERAGIRQGDVILECSYRPTNTPAEIHAILAGAQQNAPVTCKLWSVSGAKDNKPVYSEKVVTIALGAPGS